MKKIILFSIFLLLFSCTERENKIELIENYDEIYNTPDKLDKISPTEELEKYLTPLFEKILRKHINYNQFESPIMITYKLFVNEKGVVEKLQRLSVVLPENAISKKQEIYNEKVEPGILKELEKIKFEPALKAGENVKFQTLMMFAVFKDKDGQSKPRVFMNLVGKGKSIGENLIYDFETVYFLSVDEPPLPVGGITAIIKNVKYPEEAKRNKVQGTVFVKAFINEYGIVNEAEIIKGTNTSLDTAAVNAVVRTKFIPGKQYGTPVKVQVAVPIVFKLK